MCQSLFFNKVGGLSPATLLKKRLWRRCFPVSFAKFLRTLFLQNTMRRLLLQNYILSCCKFTEFQFVRLIKKILKSLPKGNICVSSIFSFIKGNFMKRSFTFHRKYLNLLKKLSFGVYFFHLKNPTQTTKPNQLFNFFRVFGCFSCIMSLPQTTGTVFSCFKQEFCS